MVQPGLDASLILKNGKGIIEEYKPSRQNRELPDAVIVAVDAGTERSTRVARLCATFISKNLPGVPALLLASNTKSVVDNHVSFQRGADLLRVAAESHASFLNDECYFVDLDEKDELRSSIEKLVSYEKH